MEHSTRSIYQVLHMYKNFIYIMIIYISQQEPQGLPRSRTNLSVRNIPLLVNNETNIHLNYQAVRNPNKAQSTSFFKLEFRPRTRGISNGPVVTAKSSVPSGFNVQISP